jgi:hypothetical protein
MNKREITFARGDILRKVLDRTGITAARPLNLRRGGADTSSAAALLRKLRGFSQNAALLSAKLDQLIEFASPKIYPEAVMKSVWAKIKKPSRRTFGQIMRRHDPRSPIPTMVFRDQKHLLSAKLDELITFADPRPRNPLGEFAPQGDGGPNPNAMATVYKMPQQEQGITGAGRTAATLLTGGALGAVGASAGKHGYDLTVKAIQRLAKKRGLTKTLKG